MPRIPKLVTICVTCKRDNVGVVLDLSDKAYRRYRKARHTVEYQTLGSPICMGSREVVPESLIFENEKAAV